MVKLFEVQLILKVKRVDVDSLLEGFLVTFKWAEGANSG